MRRKASICLLIALFAVAFVMPVAAQESATRGNIGGTVVDTSGAVIPGAKVTATGPTGTLTQLTNQEGNFLFRTLIPGAYAVKVEKENFKSASAGDVQVVINRTTALRLTLQAGAQSETVEVTANSVAIDTSSTAISTNLTDSYYASVPVPRGVASLFYNAVGVTNGGGTGSSNPSISGGSGLENLYIADGVNITDPAFGGLGVFTRIQGAVGTGVNLSFIKEVQVKTGGFEPQYGQSTGGIVQMVTKSGGNAYHGAIAGYFAPNAFEADRKQRDDVRTNNIGRIRSLGNYDASFELGGYVPGFKNNLFFFGSFNPAYTRQNLLPPQFANDTTTHVVGLYSLFGGKDIVRKYNTYNYDGKLTFKLNDRNQVEASVFGDPSHTGTGPYSTALTFENTAGFSKWEYGTRNIVARYNGALTNTWTLNLNYTHNNNDFTETPLADVFAIQDITNPSLSVPIGGFGFLENHKSRSNSWTVDTSKVFSALGEHTLTFGFNQQRPEYNNIKSRTGGRYTVPATNVAGTSFLSAVQTANCTAAGVCPQGLLADASFSLRPLTAAQALTCTLCPLYTNPTNGVTQQVLMVATRGEFGPGNVQTEGNYMAGYGNDSWAINKYVTVNLGLRWEQYHIAGDTIKYTFTDNWSPRLGFTVDPWGDRKTKLFANFGRYAYQTPLDAAIRSLSNELDLTSMAFAPVVNGPGSVTFVPDAAHLLNRAAAAGGISGGVSLSLQSTTGFAPGAKMQYQDEFLVGFEREMKGGIVLSGRYIDRRLKRMLEDVAGLSPESALCCFAQNYFLGNPGRNTDYFTNENPQLYASFPAGTGVPPASCDPSTVNDPIVDANNNTYLPGQGLCYAQSGTDPVTGDPLFGGEPIPDGKPDGFPDAVRNYQGVEIEVNKSFSKGWLMRANYRIARNYGNYEGAYRNDNGQTDPNISSLFDFTEGVAGMLGDQFKPGPLPTDRRHTVNGSFSYTFPGGRAKNLTLGTTIRVQSGTPISTFANHPAYQNAGEVPLGGRGALGRTPFSGTVDIHADYPWSITEKSKLRFGADLFNVSNSKPVFMVDMNRDISAGLANSNPDFRKPGNITPYQLPFYARFSVRWEF